MTAEEIRAEMARISREIRILSAPCEELAQQLAELTCPYKVGQILTRDRSGRAWVNQILPGYGEGEWRVELYFIDENGDRDYEAGQCSYSENQYNDHRHPWNRRWRPAEEAA